MVPVVAVSLQLLQLVLLLLSLQAAKLIGIHDPTLRTPAGRRCPGGSVMEICWGAVHLHSCESMSTDVLSQCSKLRLCVGDLLGGCASAFMRIN